MLTDFSVAQDSSLLVKTPDMFPYIAPECWSGQAQPASDQYGLAAIAYELLTGHPLFQGHSEQIMRHLHTTMPPQALTLFAPHLSPALSNVVRSPKDHKNASLPSYILRKHYSKRAASTPTFINTLLTSIRYKNRV